MRYDHPWCCDSHFSFPRENEATQSGKVNIFISMKEYNIGSWSRSSRFYITGSWKATTTRVLSQTRNESRLLVLALGFRISRSSPSAKECIHWFKPFEISELTNPTDCMSVSDEWSCNRARIPFPYTHLHAYVLYFQLDNTPPPFKHSLKFTLSETNILVVKAIVQS